MRSPVVTLTDAAIQHIQQMISKQPGTIGFRLAIKKTGCSGYAYLPQLIEKANETDIFYKQKDLTVYIEAGYLELLKGVIVDYAEETMVGGLKQSRLIYLNPNEKNRCGCGESFTV